MPATFFIIRGEEDHFVQDGDKNEHSKNNPEKQEKGQALFHREDPTTNGDGEERQIMKMSCIGQQSGNDSKDNCSWKTHDRKCGDKHKGAD